MDDLIIEKDEREPLFFALYYYLCEETDMEVNHHQSEEVNKKVEKLRRIVERLALDLGFDKKYDTDDWIAAGITKFTSKKELEEILKKFPDGDVLSKIHRKKLKYFYKKSL